MSVPHESLVPASPIEITLSTIQSVLADIKPFIHRTPVFTSNTIDALAGCHVLIKAENLQKVGAFKIRGATFAIRSILSVREPQGLTPENLTVVTHSSGNHAQALALAARQFGVRCHIVMPSNAPEVKKAAVAGYGAVITFCEPTLVAREETALQVMRDESAVNKAGIVEFVPPYNDWRVIAGQGTLALEFLEQAREKAGASLDVLITPVGGGGMLSGCAIAAKGLDPSILLVGAEPLGADDAYRSFQSGKLMLSVAPDTVADGLRTSLGDITFPLIMKHVDAIHTVTEEQIIRSLKLVYERVKLVIEPSAAVPLAVVLYSKEFKSTIAQLTKEKGRPLNVGVVFSGGNVELMRVLKLLATLED